MSPSPSPVSTDCINPCQETWESEAEEGIWKWMDFGVCCCYECKCISEPHISFFLSYWNINVKWTLSVIRRPIVSCNNVYITEWNWWLHILAIKIVLVSVYVFKIVSVRAQIHDLETCHWNCISFPFSICDLLAILLLYRHIMLLLFFWVILVISSKLTWLNSVLSSCCSAVLVSYAWS